MINKRARWQMLVLFALALALFGCARFPNLSEHPQEELEPLAAPVFEFVDGNARVFIGFRVPPGPAEEALVRAAGGKINYTYWIVPAIAATLPQAAIEALSRNPNVTYIEPDGQVYPLSTELDNTWGVKRIGAGTVHSSGNTGSGIRVAILDTGIDYTHPDLAANYRGGYDFYNGDNDPMDDHGHGTHVAGTVAALWNGVGVVGAAPTADLYSLKVLSAAGPGTWSAVIAALEWCVSHSIHVANMSLGGTGTRTVEQACNNAYAAGVLLVSSAGNAGEGADTVSAPACYNSVIAVAATDTRDQRASFSSTGPSVELAAPGVSIRSTLMGGGYGTMSGTSMASPHVAGTAALVWAANPSWTNAQVRQRLVETADDLGAAGWDPSYGYGLVDADEAAAGGTLPPEPEPTGTITVTKTVVGPAPSTAWAFTGNSPIGAFTLPAGGGTRTFAGLPGGTYTITETVKPDYTVTYRVNNGSTVTGNSVAVELLENNTVTVEFVNTYVLPTPTIMFVSAIEMAVVAQNRNFSYATATVTVVDEDGVAMEQATVYGAWSGAASGTSSGTTDSQGKVTFKSSMARQPITMPFMFCVTDVTKSGSVYDPERNVQSCGTVSTP